MDDADSWLLLVFLVCLVLSAFFSSAESAYIALSRLRVRYLVESGIGGAPHLARATEKPERFLATVLLGNNLVNVTAATLGTILAVAAFGAINGPIIAVVGVTAIFLVFGEVIPKNFAVRHAQRLALAYIKPLKVVEWCFYPFVLALGRIGSRFSKMVAQSEGDRTLVSEDEIRSAISAGEVEGVVEQDEANMLREVFEFTDRPVSKVMIPRMEITWVEQGMKLGDFLLIYTQKPYSRFPVYKDNTDDVVGILFARDVLKGLADDSTSKEDAIDGLLRSAHFVPESKKLGELLAEMRDGGYHIVIVVDEFGGIAGMATLGQLIEEIVGDTRDELISEEKDFVVTGDSTFQLDGGFRVEEANEELGLDLPLGDYETVAGFILSHLYRIPKQGEQMKYRNLKIAIAEMRGMKIEKVMVTVEKDESPKDSTSS